jgi:ABC-2 type transport system ATP-binding protein
VVTTTVIEVDNLRKLYGSLVAVDDVSFTVRRGEIFGLLGLNGAGKTTAVECIQGLRKPDSGHMSVLGLDPQTQVRELRRLIGSQLQESALPDRVKVWEALDLFSSFGSPIGEPAGRGRETASRSHANSRKGRLAPWEPLLEQWGLSAKRKASFGSLSGGQRQRLFVALALVNRPQVVFLDEMTTGLDAAARRVAWDLISAIRDRGSTVVLVTHFMDEAERLCDRVAIMKAGRLVAMDSPQGLIATHAREIRVRFGAGEAEEGTTFDWLRKVPHVQGVTQRGGRVEVRGTGPVIATVASALVDRGILPADLQVEQPTLEEVFLKVVGHSASGADDADEGRDA